MANTLTVNHKYKPLFNPDGPRYTLLTGGRGSGKSFALSTALCIWLREPGRKILFTRYTLTSAKDSIIPEFLEKLDLLGIAGEFSLSANGIQHKDGGELIFRGIKTSEGVQTAKLKSIQGVNAWVLDEAEELCDEEVFDRIDLSVRDNKHCNRIVLCLNPAHKSHWLHERFFKSPRPDCQYIHSDYRDNIRNLPADYVARAEEMRAANTRRFEHVWLGAWLEEIEGALWTWEMIQTAKRTFAAVPMKRIVVSIDPAVTANANSDETGIIVAGKGQDGRFYVLEDKTLKGTPLQWAGVAVALYRKHKADRIIGEVNNGGDMIESTLRVVDPYIPYTAVHATRGKTTRAEPVSALYEQGMASHADGLRELEDEMMTYTGAASDKSPNRLDALVWAATELMDTQAVRPFEAMF